MSAEKCEFCGALENVEYREPRWEGDEPPRACDACAVKMRDAAARTTSTARNLESPADNPSFAPTPHPPGLYHDTNRRAGAVNDATREDRLAHRLNEAEALLGEAMSVPSANGFAGWLYRVAVFLASDLPEQPRKGSVRELCPVCGGTGVAASSPEGTPEP